MHAIGNHCYSVGNVVADTIKEEEKRALAFLHLTLFRDLDVL